MGYVKEMTEEEFKTQYKRAFLEAYRSAVSAEPDFATIPGVAELLTTAEERATIAWKQYLKENPK